ncbi:MAG TPA: YbfB/YjiJ family MFS transporter, partial [Candidimonas sp.]|nr:YbfB/YjiJ family MFS transporter [Candidimonas sp.]
WVWIIVGLAATPSSFLWDRIAHSMGQVRALMLAFGLQTVSVIVPVMTDGAALNVIGAILFGATFVGIVSLTLTLIGRHFPANPAKAMARMTLSYGAAQIIAPAMAGYIATVTGSYQGALIVTAIVMVGGMVFLYALMKEERREGGSATRAVS